MTQISYQLNQFDKRKYLLWVLSNSVWVLSNLVLADIRTALINVKQRLLTIALNSKPIFVVCLYWKSRDLMWSGKWSPCSVCVKNVMFFARLVAFLWGCADVHDRTSDSGLSGSQFNSWLWHWCITTLGDLFTLLWCYSGVELLFNLILNFVITVLFLVFISFSLFSANQMAWVSDWVSDWVRSFSQQVSSAMEGTTEMKFGTRVA